jgi:dTDP-4-dehydrorhamnose reductase
MELVLPITTEEYNSIAQRSRYSVLKHDDLQTKHVEPLRPSDEAIKELLRKETGL